MRETPADLASAASGRARGPVPDRLETRDRRQLARGFIPRLLDCRQLSLTCGNMICNLWLPCGMCRAARAWHARMRVCETSVAQCKKKAGRTGQDRSIKASIPAMFHTSSPIAAGHVSEPGAGRACLESGSVFEFLEIVGHRRHPIGLPGARPLWLRLEGRRVTTRLPTGFNRRA